MRIDSMWPWNKGTRWNGQGVRRTTSPAEKELCGCVKVASRYSMAKNLVPLPHFVITDAPAAKGMQASSDIDYYVTFKAQIIDKQTGAVVAEKEGYWVRIKGPYKPAKFLGLFGRRKITYGGFDH
jgi:hypothetical protein